MSSLLQLARREPDLPVGLVFDEDPKRAFSQACRYQSWGDLARAVGGHGRHAELWPVEPLHDLDIGPIGAVRSEAAWRHAWLDACWTATGRPGSLEEAVRMRPEPTVFLVGGLEKFFLPPIADAFLVVGLRVLLTDCLDWIRDIPGRPLGLVVFVRQDLAVSTIKQNRGQFLVRHDVFAL